MPHLKVKSHALDNIANIVAQSNILNFVARSSSAAELLLGVVHRGEHFLLQFKPSKACYLLKYDKVTRPANVILLKEALDLVAKELSLEILSSNITHKKSISNVSPYLKKIEDFEHIIYPKEKLCIEVGFGSGRHLLYQAQQNPDILYIGLEIHTPSIQQVLKQITLQALENIWIVNYDARLFLEMLESNSCKQIFVHFPVPWDKKPHRRVISEAFLAESLRVLDKGGTLELRTDSNNYFWYSLETFFKVPNIALTVQKNKSLEVSSKYEDRWRKQKKDIYDVLVQSNYVSELKKRVRGFSFNIVKYNENVALELPRQPVVKEDYFVHFERVYHIVGGGLLLKCAFGSFDRPEHKYIVVNEQGVDYFASGPVKTSINAKAHRAIVKILST